MVANGWKFKLQIIHAMKHSSRWVRRSYVCYPRLKVLTCRNLPLFSFIATKIYQAAVGGCPCVWSCYETQIPATRTRLLQANFASTCFSVKQRCRHIISSVNVFWVILKVRTRHKSNLIVFGRETFTFCLCESVVQKQLEMVNNSLGIVDVKCY